MQARVYPLWGSGRGTLNTLANPQGAVVDFVVEPLATPAVVRPDHDPHVLYVRLTAPCPGRAGRIAVLPGAGEVVRSAFASAEPPRRGVLVGADALFLADAEGRGVALDALVDVIRAFTDAGVPFVWRTRGGIDHGGLPPALAHALVAAGGLCAVELGVATLDDDDARALEGGLARPARKRLHLASALVARGVSVRAVLDPLVPMLTDQQGPLEDLVAALAAAGVRRLGARYITLTRDRARLIAERLAGMQRALLQGVFADEPWRHPEVHDGEHGGPREVHKRIPASLRRRGHDRLAEIGARLGVVVDILDPVDVGEMQPSQPPTSSTPPRARATRTRPQLELFAGRRR
jgi:hypothetical protein